jgi:hypothetical protein
LLSVSFLEDTTMAKDKDTAADTPVEDTKTEKAAGAPPVYHADRGEGIPTPPLKTATDSE